MVSQNRRYMPELVAFRETVGRPRARCRASTAATSTSRTARTRPRSCSRFAQPLLLDMAIHLFDGAARDHRRRPALGLLRRPTARRGAGTTARPPRTPIFRHQRRRAVRLRRQLGGGRRRHLVDRLVAGGRRARHRDMGRQGRAARPARPGASIAASAPIRHASRRGPLPRARGRAERLRRRPADGHASPQGECHDNLRSLAMCHAAVESAGARRAGTVPARCGSKCAVTTRTATRAGRVGSSSDRNSRAAPACRQ